MPIDDRPFHPQCERGRRASASRARGREGAAVALLLLGSLFLGACAPRPLRVFDTATRLVNRYFFDPTFRGLPWEEKVSSARRRLNSTSTEAEVAATLNQLLDELRTSHTRFFTADDAEYWALRSIFTLDVDGYPIPQVGAFFEEQNGRWFAKSVWEGCPAYESGIRAGDEIVNVDGAPLQPVRSFWNGETPQPVTVSYRRHEGERPRTSTILPRPESFQRSMLRATQYSTRFLRREGKTVGYFHLWAGTHESFRRALATASRTMNGCDGLILDLRGGFGGAGPAYLDPFFDRKSDGQMGEALFTKPVVALTDRGTRSGKEWISQLLKERGRATLVGERTAGATRAGTIFQVGPNGLLFLAVAEGLSELEGVGVTPHVVVDVTLPFSGERDLILERGLEVMLEEVTFSGSAPK